MRAEDPQDIPLIHVRWGEDGAEVGSTSRFPCHATLLILMYVTMSITAKILPVGMSTCPAYLVACGARALALAVLRLSR